jgi:hypothetical protein
MFMDIVWIVFLILAISFAATGIVLTFLAGASDRWRNRFHRQQQAKDYEIILTALIEKVESQEKNRGKSEKSENVR